MHRLVCSGYARPGQTSGQLLDSFELGMLLDVAYGESIAGMSAEQRAEVDVRLDEVNAEYDQPDPEELVEVVRKSDGNVIQISEARLAQLRRNAAGAQQQR